MSNENEPKTDAERIQALDEALRQSDQALADEMGWRLRLQQENEGLREHAAWLRDLVDRLTATKEQP